MRPPVAWRHSIGWRSLQGDLGGLATGPLRPQMGPQNFSAIPPGSTSPDTPTVPRRAVRAAFATGADFSEKITCDGHTLDEAIVRRRLPSAT